MTWSARVALLLAACLAGCEPAPPRQELAGHDLHLRLQELASLAAEAELLTSELAAGHLDRSFAWVHQQALGDEARRVAAGIAQPAPVQLQEAQRAALVLAASLQQELTRVAPLQRQPSQLHALRERFAAVQREARALEPPS